MSLSSTRGELKASTHTAIALISNPRSAKTASWMRAFAFAGSSFMPSFYGAPDQRRNPGGPSASAEPVSPSASRGSGSLKLVPFPLRGPCCTSRSCGPLGQKCRGSIEKPWRRAAGIGVTQGHGLQDFGRLATRPSPKVCHGRFSAYIVMTIHRSRPKIATGHNRECVRFRDRYHARRHRMSPLQPLKGQSRKNTAERAQPWHPDTNDWHT